MQSLWTDARQKRLAAAEEIVFRYRIAVTRQSIKPIFIFCRLPTQTRAWYVRHRGLFLLLLLLRRDHDQIFLSIYFSLWLCTAPQNRVFLFPVVYSWCRTARAPPQKRTTVVTRRRGGDARARKPAGGGFVFMSYYYRYLYSIHILIYYNINYYCENSFLVLTQHILLSQN